MHIFLWDRGRRAKSISLLKKFLVTEHLHLPAAKVKMRRQRNFLNERHDQITAIKFWDEVAKIGEKKMVPQWSMSEADKNRLSTFFAIALKHAQGMWNEASGTYAQSITLLNGLSDTDKELLKKEVDIFVACMQNMV